MINYRKAKPADIPTLIQMRLGYMHETHTDLEEPVFETIADKTKGYFQEHLNRDCVVYLAEEDGKAAGCVFFLCDNNSLAANPALSELYSVLSEPVLINSDYDKEFLKSLNHILFLTLQLK